jgi:hypothetical protein
MLMPLPNPSVQLSGCGDRVALAGRANQNYASTTAARHCLVHAHTPANALRRSRAGAASEPVQFAAPCSFVVGAAPNPSFKWTANGVSPWPRGRVGYHRPRGQGATPLAAT